MNRLLMNSWFLQRMYRVEEGEETSRSVHARKPLIILIKANLHLNASPERFLQPCVFAPCLFYLSVCACVCVLMEMGVWKCPWGPVGSALRCQQARHSVSLMKKYYICSVQVPVEAWMERHVSVPAICPSVCLSVCQGQACYELFEPIRRDYNRSIWRWDKSSAKL